MTPEINERVRALEVKHESLVREIKELRETDNEISAKLDTLIEAHTKYKGMIGGLMLAGSLVASLVALVGFNLKQWWTS